MKEMRLFEIELKEPNSNGNHEFYVVADTAEDATEKARQWVVEDHIRWWEESGRESFIFEAYAEDKGKEDVSDEEILATKKYQKQAEKDVASYLKDLKNLSLVKLFDEGKAIV